MKAKKGDWVRIYKIILEVGERASNIPKETQDVPLEMWVKGFLLDNEASIGDEVQVETYIGRKVEGTLIEMNPYYKHDYGKLVPELLYIGNQARNILSERGELIG